ncbi:hypothetical protein FKB34_12155 [Glycocaulis profundi]|nr:hypothetical protein FKB34_12155 [Glycocaulis profundi]
MSCLKHLSLLAASVLLAACASAPAIDAAAGLEGQGRAEVIARLGEPVSAAPQPGGGERLLYLLRSSQGVFQAPNHPRDRQRAEPGASDAFDHVPLGRGGSASTRRSGFPTHLSTDERSCPVAILLDADGIVSSVSADESRCSPRG